MFKIYFATDHAGLALKDELIAYVTSLGHTVTDMGATSLNLDDDYPDLIAPCATQVAQEPDAFGVILGGSGQGEAMVANRVPGIRAAVFYGGPTDIVKLAREHNDANVLSLGARFLTTREAVDALALFLETPFSNEERHVRRIAKF